MGRGHNPQDEQYSIGWLTQFSGLDGLCLEPGVLALPQPKRRPLGAPPMPAHVNAVGILDKLAWSGGATAPIDFVCHVPGKSGAELRAKLLSPLTSVSIQLSWEIKSWLAATEAKINTNNGIHQIDLSHELVGGEGFFYRFSFSIIPSSGSWPAEWLALLHDRRF
jgi:hypothetical protein